jgi:sporulation integral membrane protein YtvI
MNFFSAKNRVFSAKEVVWLIGKPCYTGCVNYIFGYAASGIKVTVMNRIYELHKETIHRAAIFFAIAAFIFIFFKYLFSYVSPFFFGFIIAWVMEPLIRLMTSKVRVKRWMASGICLLLFIAAVSSLGTWVVTMLARQTMAFAEAVPLYVDDFLALVENINEWALSWSDYTLPDMRDAMISGVASLFGSGVRNQSIRIVSNVPGFFIGLILALVSAFFFMKDRPLIMKMLQEHCPDWLAEKLRRIRSGMARAVGGYLRAQLILMTIVGIIGIIGLLLLSNPYALMIGLILAVLDFLPILGSGSLLIPWALFHLLTGQFSHAIGLLALYGVITVTRQALEPKILSEQIGIHPLVSLISVFAGFKIFGFIGIFIGPALVMVFISMKEQR